MLRFILGRVAVLIPTFLGVTLIAFSFIRLLPGDPVMLMSGERVMSPERHAEIMHELGYDRPRIRPVSRLSRRDPGRRFRQLDRHQAPGRCRSSSRSFPATLELSICAILFAVVLGIPAGVFAAVKRGIDPRPGDHGRRARRLFDADLLVGPAAHHPLLRHARLDAGLRPHLASLLLPAGHRLHADRLAALRASRAPSSRRSAT